MTKRMLVDATHPEETRVAIIESNRDVVRLQDLDSGLASKPVLRGNIYLAKVIRIEPALAAAFVEYGGNRHGFLPFSEIHPDYYFRLAGGEEDGGGAQDDAEVSETVAPVSNETAPVVEVQAQSPSPQFTGGVDGFMAVSPHDPDSHSDNDVGLITNFGAADTTASSISSPELIHSSSASPNDSAIPSDEGHGDSESVKCDAESETIIESVGGDAAPERIFRQPRRNYKIQDVLNRGQIMLIQVVKEERGNKGAALTTFLSLAGRYCVLMPNTDHGGGVSRKITSFQERRRMKDVLDQLEVPEGMAVILRTAGMDQPPPEIQRDLEYLMRLWDSVREQTLQSVAPTLIYEEANLIKRSVRDLYTPDISEILVAGVSGYERTREFMCTIMPDSVDKIRLYDDPVPLFFRYQVESQIDSLHNPIVQLRSGGYLVISPTEALVAIDVNSGRSTREKHIEETAIKTNLEAADEVARQLRLRDLAGLVVIDFIDMEENRNNLAVERRLKEAMKNDRARVQIGRISPFGLMELSRQRLRPSMMEMNFEKCPHCSGIGYVRSVDSAALSVLRAIEEEGIRQRSAELVVHVPTKVALYILNQKRVTLGEIEQRYALHVLLHSDDTLVPPDYRLERSRARGKTVEAGRSGATPAVDTDKVFAAAESEVAAQLAIYQHTHAQDEENGQVNTERFDRPVLTESENSDSNKRGRGRRPPRAPRVTRTPYDRTATVDAAVAGEGASVAVTANDVEGGVTVPDGDDSTPRRRRGRRGGRRRHSGEENKIDGTTAVTAVANGDATSISIPAANNADGNIRRNGGRSDNRRPPRRESQPNSRIAPPPAVMANYTAPFEIDTTPRPLPIPASVPPSLVSGRLPVASHETRQPSPYEVVNPTPEKPKGGWWRKLTGGEG